MEKLSVTEMSEKYGIPASTIRDRINHYEFNKTYTRRKNGVREFPITPEFVSLVFTTGARYKKPVPRTNELQLPVNDVCLDYLSSHESVAVTLVFSRPAVMKLVDFIRSFGGK